MIYYYIEKSMLTRYIYEPGFISNFLRESDSTGRKKRQLMDCSEHVVM
jgi:hypothetical protein